jgi:hypothetical protein
VIFEDRQFLTIPNLDRGYWGDKLRQTCNTISVYMFWKMLEKLTGKDDLERVAYKEDLGQLNAYLKTRRVLIPQRPRRFLDATSFTQEQLLQQIRMDAQELSGTPFEPWILNLDGKRRLPAFSSPLRMQDFSSKISQEMNKVFSLGGAEFLLEDITKNLDIDFVDLNLFSQKSWEIGVRRQGT